MTVDQTTVGMIGLPSAGKTTYAVVVHQVCDAGLDGMSITKYAVGNREYLNAQADILAGCTSLERTSQQQRDELRLRLKLSADGADRELVMPDHSGEFLRDSMATRVLDVRLSTLVIESNALLLFVRSDDLLKPQSLHDFNALLRLTGEQPEGTVAPESPEDWQIGLAATQARLADVVQELVRLRDGRALRLCLILSAWDTQSAGEATPGEWAERELPLLVSTLTNSASIEWEVFGVSAQGGDFNGPDLEELKKLPVELRSKVHERDGTLTGIGAPLRWALETQ